MKVFALFPDYLGGGVVLFFAYLTHFRCLNFKCCSNLLLQMKIGLTIYYRCVEKLCKLFVQSPSTNHGPLTVISNWSASILIILQAVLCLYMMYLH